MSTKLIHPALAFLILLTLFSASERAAIASDADDLFSLVEKLGREPHLSVHQLEKIAGFQFHSHGVFQYVTDGPLENPVIQSVEAAVDPNSPEYKEVVGFDMYLAKDGPEISRAQILQRFGTWPTQEYTRAQFKDFREECACKKVRHLSYVLNNGAWFDFKMRDKPAGGLISVSVSMPEIPPAPGEYHGSPLQDSACIKGGGIDGETLTSAQWATIETFAPPVIGIEQDPEFLKIKAMPRSITLQVLGEQLHVVESYKIGTTEYLHVGGCMAALEVLTGQYFTADKGAEFYGERMGNAKYSLATARQQRYIIKRWKDWLQASGKNSEHE